MLKLICSEFPEGIVLMQVLSMTSAYLFWKFYDIKDFQHMLLWQKHNSSIVELSNSISPCDN